MSTSKNPASSTPAGTDVSINSPPSKRQAASEPTKQTTASRTGFPLNIEGPYEKFTQIEEPDIQRGNSKYDFMMQAMGHYGHFLPLDRKASSLTPITLDTTALREGIRLNLTEALTRSLHMKGQILQTDVAAMARNTAATLTNGCMMMLYCRLRAINRSFFETSASFVQRAHVPDHFEIPTPFALAFQFLGLFRVENMTRELELIPIVSDADAKLFCLGTHTWSPPAYQTAMEFAKSLGISFKGIDQTVKFGSAWWLLKSNEEDGNYTLQCCIPESNYTPEDAVIRSLWCVTSANNFHSDIASLDALTMNRGSFLRNPPPDIALTSFYGMMETPETLWDVR